MVAGFDASGPIVVRLRHVYHVIGPLTSSRTPFMVMRLRRTYLFAVAFMLLAFTPGLARAQDGTITGTLTDAKSGNPLTSASIEVKTANGTLAGRAVSNADGKYRVSVAPGTYSVSVRIVGYNAATIDNVSVTAGGSATADAQLTEATYSLDPIVVSASKQQEKATEAPAHVEVINATAINNRPAVTPVEHLRGTPGVDIITQGVQSTNVVVRGFNNIFSGALYTLTDNRMAGVPSLRVNVMHFVPTTDEDLQRMEVVLGPGSALYGPNTANGVLHMITKSPLLDPGTTISATGGSQDLFQLTGRSAVRFSDRFGGKISGSYMKAQEFAFNDIDEDATRANATGAATKDFFKADMMRALGITSAEADARIAKIGVRDNDVERYSGEARIDVRATEKLTTVFQAGLTNVGSGIELTGLGAAQVKDWKYSYVQARANMDRLFAQVYLNKSDAGDTYLLRTAQPIVDKSSLLVAQLQHGFTVWNGRQNFTYGADYFKTNPVTEGTINGKYENDDETTEYGGYLQSETAVTPKVDLVLAGRIDHHSALPKEVFSPRAAIVFKPIEGQSFRVTYNRAFSTPTSLNQFLDLPTAVPNQTPGSLNASAAQLGYSVRVQGTGTTGFHFRQADGSYLMRSPFTPTAFGGPSQILPADAASFFGAAVQVVQAQTPANAFQAAGLTPEQQAAIFAFLAGLKPTAAQVGTNILQNGTSSPISELIQPDIAPIREETNTTFEAGYKGVIKNKLSISIDGWWSKHENLVTPLTVYNPLVALNGALTGAYVAQQLVTGAHLSPQQAGALAAALAPNFAKVPVGVISSAEVDANGAQFLATYTNVPDELKVHGIDVGAEYLIGNYWSVAGTGSLVNADHFTTASVGTVTLNAPKKKASFSVNYRNPAFISGEVRVRWNDEFPVQSGVYVGTKCLGGVADLLTQDCVKSYTLLDASASYTVKPLHGAEVQLSVNNILDEDYKSFIGVPSIGRMALLRLRYTLK
jgi:iron complex outermembrane receptor protein